MEENIKNIGTLTKKLFINESDVLNVDIIVAYTPDGELVTVVAKDVADEFEFVDKFDFVDYSFVFSKPTYNLLNKYRQKSMEYDVITKERSFNQFKMRDFLIIYHLRDWTLVDENNDKIELKFDDNNALSDESLELVYKLHPSIIDVVMTVFERKMALV